MKRKHLNLALAAAVLVLAAATYFSREQPEPPPPPLTALKADDINRILVRHAGRDDIRLEKRGATWWLTAPVEARAERIEVGALLELAGRASQRRYPAAEMDLAKLGLAPSTGASSSMTCASSSEDSTRSNRGAMCDLAKPCT
jgi:hypothetical protein